MDCKLDGRGGAVVVVVGAIGSYHSQGLSSRSSAHVLYSTAGDLL